MVCMVQRMCNKTFKFRANIIRIRPIYQSEQCNELYTFFSRNNSCPLNNEKILSNFYLYMKIKAKYSLIKKDMHCYDQTMKQRGPDWSCKKGTLKRDEINIEPASDSHSMTSENDLNIDFENHLDSLDSCINDSPLTTSIPLKPRHSLTA